MRRRIGIAIGLLSILGTASAANATPVVGVTISSDGTVIDNAAWNLGYSFVVNSATSVVSLGVWDDGGDGLLNRHEVGLWASDGTLLAHTFVGAGTAGILDSGFRFTDISAVSLNVGQTYYVAATFNGPGDDPWITDVSSVLTASSISYDSRRYEFGSALTFPDLAGSGFNGYWGGNVRLDEAPVPEPMTLLLVGSGVAGMWRARRRL